MAAAKRAVPLIDGILKECVYLVVLDFWLVGLVWSKWRDAAKSLALFRTKERNKSQI